MDDKLSITLQMGILQEVVVLSREDSDMNTIRQHALAMIEKNSPKNQQGQRSEKMLFFQHNYQDENVLQLLQNTDQLQNGAVVEVVLSSENEKPSQPHSVNIQSYYSPTFCDYCGEILVGLTKQGLRCSKCRKNFHKKCAFGPLNNCAGCEDSGGISADNCATPETSEPPLQNGYSLPHTFVVHSYKKPTVCRVCNTLLMGIIKQGLQCRDCRVNVHRKCAALLANDCHAVEPMEFQSQDSVAESSASSSENAAEIAENMVDLSIPDANDELILLGRIPGSNASYAASRKRSPPAIISGWMLHFTNSNAPKKRHFWKMDQRCITLYTDDTCKRTHKVIQLSEILGLKLYEGPPLDRNDAPHCIEIQTANCVYYVGENLDWYMKSNMPPKIPRRESGVGMVSAKKWLEAIRQALMPPQDVSSKAGKEAAEADKPAALEFSNIYQLIPDAVLGNGQFGTVFSGVHRASKREVAIKAIVKDRSMSRKWRDALRNEVAILQKLNHPGIITLEAVFEFSDKIYVVMEKMKADMLELILSNPDGRLSERITKFLIVQILQALKYLHEKDIAHCDLKPENVLLSSDHSDFPQSKLCDFGYARMIGDNTFRNTVVGTPAYLAPEVLQKRGYNKSLDMWSVGVVIYVTLSGTFPFNEGEEIEAQIKNAAFMYPPRPWNEISASATNLISQLLQVQPLSRLSIDQCLAHSWLVDDPILVADLRNLEKSLNINYLTCSHAEPPPQPS